MKTVAIILLTTLSATPVSAQVSTPASGIVRDVPTYTGNQFAETRPLRGSLETPTMRRQKLARAEALRAQVRAWQAANGGPLTADQRAYVRETSRDILSYQLRGPTKPASSVPVGPGGQ